MIDLNNESTMTIAAEAEESVIGAIIDSPEAINSVAGVLRPEMFHNSGLGKIFKICQELMLSCGTTDLITVSAEMRRRGLSDLVLKVTELSGHCITDQMIDTHAKIVQQMFMLRQYASLGEQLHAVALSGDIDAAVDLAENKIIEISGQLYAKEPRKLGGIVEEGIATVQKIVNKEITMIGVPSGFIKLDRITGGFKPCELSIIAGRPSHGKTALALQIAKNAAQLEHPVLIFSHEMRDIELGFRFLSGSSGYSNSELMNGEVDMYKLYNSTDDLVGLPIFIDDSAGMTVIELRAKLRKMILKHKIELVIVDYLQLMNGTGQNREQEIAGITRGLKAMAKDLKVAVVALSQLNRSPETRGDKMPQLSDLRESGAIEQDTDLALLIYRPVLYKESDVTIGDKKLDTYGLIVVNIGKNRNGRTGTVGLHHNESLTKIEEKETVSF